MSANTAVANPEFFGIPTVGAEIAKTVYHEEQTIANHERHLSTEQTIGQVVVGGADGFLGGSMASIIVKAAESLSGLNHPIPDKYIFPAVILGTTISSSVQHVMKRRQAAEQIANF